MPNAINPNYKLVNGRIRQFKKHLNLSQAEFNQLLKMDQTVIFQIGNSPSGSDAENNLFAD